MIKRANLALPLKLSESHIYDANGIVIARVFGMEEEYRERGAQIVGAQIVNIVNSHADIPARYKNAPDVAGLIASYAKILASHAKLLAAANALTSVPAHPPYMDSEWSELETAIAKAEQA